MWAALVLVPRDDEQTRARVRDVPLARGHASAWVRVGGAPAALFLLPRLAERQVLDLADLLVDLTLAWMIVARPPRLYDLRLAPRADPGGPEIWPAGPWIFHPRAPRDCKGLAAWRVAELRLLGEEARVVADRGVDRGGALVYHLRVRRRGGRVEDPLAIVRRGRLTERGTM